MCSTSSTESSDSRTEYIKRHISEEIVCNVSIASYLLDKKSGASKNLLSKSITMTQDSVRQVKGLRFQHSTDLGAVVLHRFLEETLLGRKPDVSSRDQMSAEPVLRMLRGKHEDSTESTKPVL